MSHFSSSIVQHEVFTALWLFFIVCLVFRTRIYWLVMTLATLTWHDGR